MYQIRGGGTGGGGSGNDYILNHDESMYLVTTTTSSYDAKNDSTKDFCTMDSFGRSISLFGAGIVLIQSLLTFSSFDNLEILHEVCLFVFVKGKYCENHLLKFVVSNFVNVLVGVACIFIYKLILILTHKCYFYLSTIYL